MSDDIVTRLRDHLAIVDHAFVWNELSEAADEIERLRADVERWRKLAHSEHYAWSQCPLNCVCMSDLYRKAKRDE